MWIALMIFLALASLAGIFYLIHCFHRCSFLTKLSDKHKFLSYFLSILPIFLIFLFGLINLMSIAVVMLHLMVFVIVADLIACIARKISGKKFGYTTQTVLAVITCAIYLGIGWYNAHHVTQTEYTLYTDKSLPGDSLRIVAIADSHMSITLNKENFAKECERMQATNPDLVVIVGDFVDDESTKEDMTAACEALGKLRTTYGVYFVYGNHDRGYYGGNYRDFSAADLVDTLGKNNITILTDESLLLDDTFYLTGRLDKWIDKNRKNAQNLTADLDPSKYILMLDHQPNDFANEAAAGPDLVICGHTHGGHIFPTGTLSQWLGFGKVDLLYGKKHIDNTDFIVTSGISGWAMPFKTGTFSEYVVIDVISKNEMSN